MAAIRNVNEQGIKIGDDRDHASDENFGCCSYLLIGISWFLVILLFPFSLFRCIKIVQEYERAVIFRLGRILPGGAKGPGLFFILPCVDTYRSIDLRVMSFSVPPQEVLTKDSVAVIVDAVVYYRIKNACMAVNNVENYKSSTHLLAQTTLRNTLGTKTLAELLSHRESISHEIQAVLDDTTEEWGVKVERVEVKDVCIPKSMQRSMAAIAEAEREAKAQIIAADGEKQASKSLKDAAIIMSENPAAIQLRYLQTLNTIAAEQNSTIIFPFPIDLVHSFMSVVHPDHRKLPDTHNVQMKQPSSVSHY